MGKWRRKTKFRQLCAHREYVAARGWSGPFPRKTLERHTDRGHITSRSLRTTILPRRRREEVFDVGALLCSFGNPELHPYVLDRLSHRAVCGVVGRARLPRRHFVGACLALTALRDVRTDTRGTAV